MAQIGHMWITSTITSPKTIMMGVPGLHVGLRGAGATPCTELSVHAPGGDRRQGRRCSETHCLRAENDNSNSFEEPEAEIYCLLLKT